jgi:hypothetical protein
MIGRLVDNGSEVVWKTEANGPGWCSDNALDLYSEDQCF